jgi:hypothetical protein
MAIRVSLDAIVQSLDAEISRLVKARALCSCRCDIAASPQPSLRIV